LKSVIKPAVYPQLPAAVFIRKNNNSLRISFVIIPCNQLKSLSRQSFTPKKGQNGRKYVQRTTANKKGAKAPLKMVIKYIKKYFKKRCF
jgi:hypothetical protein